MPISTMEELAAIEVGQQIAVDDQPLWRVEEGWFATAPGGPGALRDKWFVGYLAKGEVLAPGEVLLKRGVIYKNSAGKYGVLIEQKGRLWRGIKFNADFTFHQDVETMDPAKIRQFVLPVQQQVLSEILIKTYEAWVTEQAKVVEADKQKAEAMALLGAQASKNKVALDVIAGFKAGVQGLMSFEPGALGGVHGPTGLKVGDSPTRETMPLLPVGTIFKKDGDSTYFTKLDNQRWKRGEERSDFTPNQFGEVSLRGYKITVLPGTGAFTGPDPTTGLSVGDLVESSGQFRGLPVGTVVEFPENKPTEQWTKFIEGDWGVSAKLDGAQWVPTATTTGKASVLATRRNRIISLPLVATPVTTSLTAQPF